MEQEQVSLLLLVSRTIKFATDHPYAATGIFGAAVGSAVTYKALSLTQQHPSVSKIFTPKAYQIALPDEDLRLLLSDPTAELRWETPDVSVTITSEKTEPLKELPIIKQEEE